MATAPFNPLTIFLPTTGPAPTPPPAPAPFIPEFLQNVTITIPGYGQIRENPYYFATAATTSALVARFGLMGAIAVTINYGEGYVISAPQEMVVLPNGKLYNAGLLAYYFVQYPEDKFPGMAAGIVTEAIQNLLSRA